MLTEIVKGVALDPREVAYVSAAGDRVVVGFKGSEQYVNVFLQDGEDLAQGVKRVTDLIQSAMYPSDEEGD